MAITSTTYTQLDPSTFKVTWVSSLTTPTYYVYLDGVLVETIERTWTFVNIPPGETLDFQVYDDSATIPDEAYSGRFVFNWYNQDTDIVSFEVAIYQSGSYTVLDSIPVSSLEHYYQYKSSYLSNETEYQFRITPIGYNQARGVPVYIAQTMVRLPDPPDASYSYDVGSQILTVEIS